ncbi:hypothetical protein D9M71_681610 [compost metagenome]
MYHCGIARGGGNQGPDTGIQLVLHLGDSQLLADLDRSQFRVLEDPGVLLLFELDRWGARGNLHRYVQQVLEPLGCDSA